jgi:hypothetical protein
LKYKPRNFQEKITRKPRKISKNRKKIPGKIFGEKILGTFSGFTQVV